MKKTLLFILILGAMIDCFSQQKNITIDVKALQNSLNNVLTESQVKGQNILQNASVPTISLPMNDGTFKSFKVVESPIWEDAKSMNKANIHTYSGISVDKDGITTRFSLTPLGLSGIIRTPLNYFIIEAVDATNNLYEVYPINAKGTGQCDVNDSQPMGKEILKNLNENKILNTAPFPNGSQLRVYRMAAAATGEFTATFGDQASAVAKITEIVNLIGAIYEAEAAIRFSLIPATTNSPYPIIFTDAATDPFLPDHNFASAAASQAGFNKMASVTPTDSFYNVLPYSLYDIGHTFNIKATGGVSGQAGPTPCVDASKARGWTEMSLSYLTGNIGGVVNIATHEIGHQFGASHSYNALGGNSGNTSFCFNGWSNVGGVEPGGGSSLMAYNSNCQSPNYTLSGGNFDSYFHTKSLEQIFQGAGFTNVNGGTCGSFISTVNNLPISNAGNDYTIPKGTPFTLTGSATDADADVLTYQWDEFDVALVKDAGAFGNGINGYGTNGSDGISAVNSTTSAPLFRSQQQTSGTRTFPSMARILLDKSSPAVSPNPNDNEGEDLPQAGRIMKFRLTVMDNKANGGGVDSDEMQLTINGATGPFLVTSQNTNTYWLAGTNQTITWSVNGTNAAPINCTSVKITLSTDNGLTFPTVLVNSTANDGSETITIPFMLTSQGRIKIESINNIFFDVNNGNINITDTTPTCIATTSTIAPSTPVTAAVGNNSLNLSTLGYKNVTSFVATTTSADATINLTGYNGTACSSPYSNQPYYKTLTFQVTTTGSYTLSGFASPTIINLYTSSFDSSNPCGNWLASNAIVYPSTFAVNTSITQTFTAGTKYILVVSPTFQNTTTGSVTINFSGAGAVQSALPEGDSYYSYRYVIVNASNNIKAISSTPDLSNSVNFPVGVYTIYGISYITDNVDLSPYLNQPLSSLQTAINNTTICAKLSSNTQTITITPVCPSTLTLAHSADDIGTGNVTKQASASGGSIIASNWITGTGTKGTYQAKNISLNTGFRADKGTTFKAEVGGCN